MCIGFILFFTENTPVIPTVLHGKVLPQYSLRSFTFMLHRHKNIKTLYIIFWSRNSPLKRFFLKAVLDFSVQIHFFMWCWNWMESRYCQCLFWAFSFCTRMGWEMRSGCRDERAGGIFIYTGVSVCASVFVCLHVQVRPCTSIKVTVVNNILLAQSTRGSLYSITSGLTCIC